MMVSDMQGAIKCCIYVQKANSQNRGAFIIKINICRMLVAIYRATVDLLQGMQGHTTRLQWREGFRFSCSVG